MDGEDAGDQVWGTLALVLALVGWTCFLAVFLGGADPWTFIPLAVVAGGGGFGLALWLRLHAHAAAAGSAAAAAGLTGYGLVVVSLLTAVLLASGLLVVVLLFLFLIALFWGPWWTAPACTVGPCAPCCCEECSCCEDCCSCGECCTCGAGGGCDCGCGDCGDCGCGGCACAGLAVAVAGRAPVAPLLQRLAHHPDLPEYEADVYRVRGVRLCVGCFTTYPAFLLAATALAFLPALPWTHLLGWGVLAALAQAVSSAGLARTRLRKGLVKASLGAGLAMVTWGVHGAPWPPAWKLAALLAALGLAYASAIPRARRMRRTRRAAG